MGMTMMKKVEEKVRSQIHEHLTKKKKHFLIFLSV